MRAPGTVHVKEQDPVVVDKDPQMQEVQQDGALAD